MRHRLYLLALLGLGSPLLAEPAQDVSATPLDYDGTPLPISEWMAEGPFQSSSDQVALATKFSQPGQHNDPTTESLQKPTAGTDSAVRVLPLHLKSEVDLYSSFRIDKSDSKESLPCFYVQAIINSQRAVDAYLLLGGDGLLQVYLNGKLVSVSHGRRKFDAESFTDSSPVSLQQGRNILAIKVIRVSASCGLVAELVPTKEAAIEVLLHTNESFLGSLLVTKQSGLTFDLRGVPQGAIPSEALEITDLSGDRISKWTLTSNSKTWKTPDTLPEGVYHVTVFFGGQKYTEDFLVGDIESIATPLVNEARRISTTPNDALNFGTLTKRMQILLAPKNRLPTNREWQRKIVYTISELQLAIKRSRGGIPAWANTPGMHLRGFMARLDGQVRHYRIFIPESYNPDKPLRLAIMVATSLSASVPFLESSFISHQLDAESLAKFASAKGIGVLWPGYPAAPYGNPCEFEHLDEVLSAVGKDYNIDSHGLYLLGTCQAAMTATMFAEHWPKRFAGLAILDPIAERVSNTGKDESMFIRFGAYRRWILDNAPLLHMDRLVDLPVYVTFDDGAPGHGSIEQFTHFVSCGTAAKANLQHKEVILSLGHMDGWRDLIDSVSLNRQEHYSDLPASDAIGTNGRTGPAMNFFSSGFVMVVGTGGGSSDVAAIKRLAEQFQDTWKNTYYGPCRVMKDVDVTPEVEKTRNLLLVGNAHTNSVWQRFDARIPLELSADSVAIGGERHAVAQASVQALFRNPDYPERRILVIGAADLANAQIGDMNLSINGWFDYSIWRYGSFSHKPLLELAERYRELAPVAVLLNSTSRGDQ